MSSGEEFDVEEILDQRRRKGELHYLVRWRGFNELYDSWEPAKSLVDCSAAVKAFITKKKEERSQSRSRSRSRGRAAKSEPGSGSRGRREPKEASRSRSRSASRKVAAPRNKAARSLNRGKKEEELEQTEKSLRLSTKPEVSTSRREKVTSKSTARQEGSTVEKRTEVVKETVEILKGTPLITNTSTMTTRQRLAVREVQNDEKPQPKTSFTTEKEDTWIWWSADYVVLGMFIVISIFIIFSITSGVDLRDLPITPSMSTLQDRLAEIYQHSRQELAPVFNRILQVLPSWNDDKTMPPTPDEQPARP